MLLLPDGSQTVYTYLNVPTSETGIATAVVVDDVAPILEVDIDGDGVIDEYRLPEQLEINVSVEPAVLWPPNHKLVAIDTVITAVDNSGGSPTITLVSITMNEGEETDSYEPGCDDTQGDGNTTDDIQVDSDGNIYLRAERSGKGDGRVYTIVYEAEDASGNTTQATATVTVPHAMK